MLQLFLFSLALATQDPAAGILIDRRLAEELSITVGEIVRVRALSGDGEERPFRVEGVFERAADPSRIARNDFEVRFHLPDFETMLAARDRVDRFAVSLRPESSVDPVARWVEGLAFGTQVHETARLANESSTTFRVVSRFHDAIGLITLLASGIFLLCLMVIRVDERRHDVGTMRLLGISWRTVVRAVVAEAVIVAAIASVLGAALGAVISAAVNSYYGAFYDTSLRFAIVTPRTLLLSVGLGIVLGVGAGVVAALRVATVPVQRLGER